MLHIHKPSKTVWKHSALQKRSRVPHESSWGERRTSRPHRYPAMSFSLANKKKCTGHFNRPKTFTRFSIQGSVSATSRTTVDIKYFLFCIGGGLLTSCCHLHLLQNCTTGGNWTISYVNYCSQEKFVFISNLLCLYCVDLLLPNFALFYDKPYFLGLDI